MPLFKSARSRATIPALLAAAAGVLLVLYAWALPPFATAVQVTDDAYVRGPVTVISPQVPGYVTEIAVQDFAEVRRGETIATIDDRIYRQRLAQGRAQLAAAEAALANLDVQRGTREAQVQVAQAGVENAEAVLEKARADTRRIEPLVAANIQSRAQSDAVHAALRQAEAGLAQARASETVAGQSLAESAASRAGLEAQVEGARATVHLAEIDLQNTRIVAPADGRLGEVGARLGAYVTAGTQLTSLVPPPRWVVANYKETQTAGMAAGQPVTFRVDALGGAALRGRIERFSPATGSEFAVIRPDNATGNFTKVAQRLPVRIAIEPDQPLAARLSPGMSVVVRVDTAAPPVR